MKAFKAYLRERHGTDIETCASELITISIEDVDTDSMIWELLEETGDETYTRETFIKVAKNILL